jgi:hypothetical protein
MRMILKHIEDGKEIGHIEVGNLVICDHCGVFETLPENERKAIAKVALDFPDSVLDDFFNRVGLKFDSKRRRLGLKALTPDLIKDVRKNKIDSQAFNVLFDEFSKESIIKSLQEVILEIKKTKEKRS